MNRNEIMNGDKIPKGFNMNRNETINGDKIPKG